MAELVLLLFEEEECERDAGAQQDTVGVIARLSTDTITITILNLLILTLRSRI